MLGVATRTRLAVPALLFLLIAGCTKEAPAPFPRRPGPTSFELPPLPDYEPSRGPAVVLSLPFRKALAVLDPFRLDISELGSLGEARFRSPNATAIADGEVAVVDIFAAQVAVVDIPTGDVLRSASPGGIPHPPPGVLREPRWLGEDILAGPDGDLHVLVSAEIEERGFVLRLDPDTLDVTDRVAVEAYPAAMAFDTIGRLWVVGAGRTTGWLRIIEPDSNRIIHRRLPGLPSDIASGPEDRMYAAFYDRGEVVELNPDGTLARKTAIRGSASSTSVFGGPLRSAGLTIRNSRAGFVAVPGRGVSSFDLKTMRVTDQIDIGRKCADVQEVEFLKGRIVATCAANARLAVLRAHPLKLLEVIAVGPPSEGVAPSDQPRGLSLLPGS